MPKQLRVVVCTVVMLAIGLPACEESAPEPPPDQLEPAPPTAAEIQQEIWKQIQPVEQNFHQGVGMAASQLEPSLSALRNALAGHAASVNGPEARRNVAAQLKDLARQADRQEKPRYVVYFYEALKLADASSAADLARLYERAQLIINRPKPIPTGFVTDERTGEVTVFLSVHVPTTGQTHTFTARQGDEFQNLRLIEIIGANKCVKFEYLLTHDEFEVCTEAARRSQ